MFKPPGPRRPHLDLPAKLAGGISHGFLNATPASGLVDEEVIITQDERFRPVSRTLQDIEEAFILGVIPVNVD